MSSFGDAAREWLHYVEFDRGRRASTMRDYRRTVKQVFLPLFGALALRAVTSELIDNHRGLPRRRGPPVGPLDQTSTCSSYTPSSSGPSATTA